MRSADPFIDSALSNMPRFPNEYWHIDVTVIRLLDDTKAYLHAVIDNFSHRILSWRLAQRLDPASGFYVKEHNTHMPHHAFDGQTPDEVYFDQVDRVRDRLTAVVGTT